MEYKPLKDIRDIAEIVPNRLRSHAMSKRERLERWVAALERESGRQLKTLFEIEHAPAAERAAIRADDSPITVAFNDERLREEGLSGDTVGDAMAFFGLSEAELHAMLCFCHHGATMSADVAAMRVRAAAVQAGGVRPPAMVIGGLASLLTGICALSI